MEGKQAYYTIEHDVKMSTNNHLKYRANGPLSGVVLGGTGARPLLNRKKRRGNKKQ